MKFEFALWYAKLINTAINIVDKDRGSNLSGEKAMHLDPKMVEHFKGIDYSKVIFITGTNGKSSTTNLVTHLLRKSGKKVISNLEGANLLPGIATILSKESSLSGTLDADYYVFETDERYLPLIYKQLPAENILITNLQKDQVQRNGDPDFIYRKLSAFANNKIHYFLNNDEPRSKSFEQFSNQVTYYGVDQNEKTFTKDETYPTEACPKCHHALTFDSYNIDGVGKYTCKHCGFSNKVFINYALHNIDYTNQTFKVKDTVFNMPYALPYMQYNYAAAIALCNSLAGVPLADLKTAFDNFTNIGGRFEVLKYKNKTIKYMRIKQENPDTLQSTLDIIASDSDAKMVCLGLYPLMDFVPFYTNSFYAFDCDFKALTQSNVERYFCFSTQVAYDTANRLIYEGVEPEKITTIETSDVEKIFSEIEKAETDNIYIVTWLDTFNKMDKYLKEVK